jgi:DNA mismatch repair protein MutS2
MDGGSPEAGRGLTFLPPPPDPVADERTLAVLDFPAVLERLAARCASDLGRPLALGLRPAARRRQVAREQEETAEAQRLLARGAPPLEGLRDVRPLLGRAVRGATLQGQELWWLGEAATCIGRLRAFVGAAADEAPTLWDQAQALADLAAVAQEVIRCLSADGEVLDRASPELAEARRQLRRAEAAVRERLEELVRDPAVQAALQEPIITLRRDRFVLPVRADQRAQVPGLVHDQSASGATVFVEPLAVVEAGNRMRAAAVRVAAVEQQVLQRLSATVAGVEAPFRQSLELAARLDLAFAKGRLAQDWQAVQPEILAEAALELHAARHPLLASPVPVDIRLGLDFDALVLTGPNTGGKTVSLKIAGLFACMAQAGLHLPAAAARVGIFPRVCGDAGDDQGVAQSLSTFSSHMRAVVMAVAAARPGALVLLDELGAGTDPGEGAALAMALLEHLVGLGARCIVTTHAAELKAFAYRTPRVENASMAFDADTLAPTYRLVIGVPGGSQAFAIARRLGLPEVIVQRAAALRRPEERHVESIIAGMASEEQRLRLAAEEAERARAEAAALRGQSQAEREALEAERGRVLAAAQEEADRLLRAARREADEVLRALRRLLDEATTAPGDGGRILERAEALRRRLTATPAPRMAAPLAVVPAVGVGDTVRVRSLDRTGVVAARPAEGEAVVQLGTLRLHVPLADLEPARTVAPRPGDAPRTAPGPGETPRWWREFRAECDLRGMRAEEALARVDKLLDDAVLVGASEVRLIHGKGTGALREAIGEFLRGHPQVAGFRLGAAGEGGAGATVVAIRS